MKIIIEQVGKTAWYHVVNEGERVIMSGKLGTAMPHEEAIENLKRTWDCPVLLGVERADNAVAIGSCAILLIGLGFFLAVGCFLIFGN